MFAIFRVGGLPMRPRQRSRTKDFDITSIREAAGFRRHGIGGVIHLLFLKQLNRFINDCGINQRAIGRTHAKRRSGQPSGGFDVGLDALRQGHVTGRFRQPGRNRQRFSVKVQRDEEAILADAIAIDEAGAFAIVLECIPSELATKISSQVQAATIGIGAGVGCDGQVLVTPDLLGLFQGFRPKFVRRYTDLGTEIRKAATAYVADVQSGDFPNASESFR